MAADGVDDRNALDSHVLQSCVSLFRDKIEPQFVAGVLDLDGIALTLDCCDKSRLENWFALGGYEDLDVFLFLVFHVICTSTTTSYRAQVVVRDYEPHFLAFDLFVNWEMRRCDMFVFDSTPDIPNNAAKWLSQIRQHVPRDNTWTCRVFTNANKLQADDFSCRVFAINAVKRMARLSPSFLYASHPDNQLITNADGELYILPDHAMPPLLMKDTQSIRRIDAFLTQSSAQQQQLESLRQHIAKRTVISADGKKQNYSVIHKLDRYRALLQAAALTMTLQQLFEALAHRTGVALLHSLSPHDTTIIKTFTLERRMSLTSTDGLVSLIFPLTLRDYTMPVESPYDERLTSIFFFKHPETAFVPTGWAASYKQLLQEQHANMLHVPWLGNADGLVTYQTQLPDRVVWTGSRVDLLKTFVAGSTLVERCHPATLSLGCSQWLASAMILRAALYLLRSTTSDFNK